MPYDLHRIVIWPGYHCAMEPLRPRSGGDLPELTLPQWRGVRVRVTDRAGGFSAAPYHSLNLGDHVGDQPDAVAANRRLASQALPGRPVWLRQVHGIEVHDAGVSTGSAQAPAAAATADAAVSGVPGRVLAVLSADCLPVVLSDDQARVIGVAHAGWRGLAAGVLEATVAALRQRLPRQEDAPLRAWLGPAIGPAAFEVGADVVHAFGADVPLGAFVPRTRVAHKWWCDLPLLAAHRLRVAGVASIERSEVCTYADRRFYSHRRDGLTGRFATFAWLTPPPGGIGTRKDDSIQVDDARYLMQDANKS